MRPIYYWLIILNYGRIGKCKIGTQASYLLVMILQSIYCSKPTMTIIINISGIVVAEQLNYEKKNE